ncbi:MAG: hypothetical protein U0T63_01030 [Buchnera aphidicola (Nurudea shiraii)]
MKHIIDDLQFNNVPRKYYYFNNRIFFLLSIIILSIIFILYNITKLQVFKTKQLIQENDFRTLRIQTKPNLRGTIKDRSGNLLALSMLVNNICIDPKLFFLKKKPF